MHFRTYVPQDFIAGFSSVFELSVGAHLASSVLLEVRSAFLRPRRDYVDYVKENLHRIQRHEVDSEKVEIAIAYFEQEWFKAFFAVKPLIRRLTVLSLAVATYSLVWLIAAGFNKELLFGVWQMALILALAVVPMPIFAVAVWLRLRSYRAVLESAADHLQREFSAALDKVSVKRGDRVV